MLYGDVLENTEGGAVSHPCKMSSAPLFNLHNPCGVSVTDHLSHIRSLGFQHFDNVPDSHE